MRALCVAATKISPELADAEIANELPAGTDDGDRPDAGPLHGNRILGTV